MRLVGVDPGKDGAIVMLDANGKIMSKHKTPIIKSQKARDEYDIPGIKALIQQLTEPNPEEVTAVLEKGQPMAMAGCLAQFQRGFSFGLYQGLFVGLGISYHVVPPRTWQKAMFEGVNAEDTKAASILVANRLWPKEDWRKSERARNADDGLTDAALISMWGLRNLCGTQLVQKS